MSLNVNIVGGRPTTTYQVNSTDAAQIIALSKQAQGSGDMGQKCKGALITFEIEDVRYAFTATPTQSGGLGLGHLAGDGDTLKLQSNKAVRDFKFISNVAGTHAMLTITIGF